MKRKADEKACTCSAEKSVEGAVKDDLEDDGAVLRDAAMRSLKRLIELAESTECESKLRYDICKWLCEMHFGKPSSAGRAGDAGDSTMTLRFEGELDKWSG